MTYLIVESVKRGTRGRESDPITMRHTHTFRTFNEALKAMTGFPKGTVKMFNATNGTEITKWSTSLKYLQAQRSAFGTRHDANTSTASAKAPTASITTTRTKKTTKRVGLSSTYLRIG